MAWCLFIFMNCDILFQAFVGIFYQASKQKYMVAYFVLAMPSGRKPWKSKGKK